MDSEGLPFSYAETSDIEGASKWKLQLFEWHHEEAAASSELINPAKEGC